MASPITDADVDAAAVALIETIKTLEALPFWPWPWWWQTYPLVGIPKDQGES